ncbi:MAG: pentapeptide repeat-containing protein [Desulfomonile tiedjei]|uniref:Pentapeptide repeat-containing protein n=1 Tax=Desulfomonile tiedjei TaxID=2358 RepID=A0A9D6Z8J1_9BACT|nr:pentapeptide repeat-containing protein [Desulfomonile tiedjei]
MAPEISPPPSWLFKPVKIQWKDLFKSLFGLVIDAGTSLIDGGTLSAPSAAKNLGNVLTSFSFDKNKPGEAAAVWITRSIVRAVFDLINDQPQNLRERCPRNIDEVTEILAKMLEGQKVTLEKNIFCRPRGSAFIHNFQKPLSHWLQKFGLEAASADTIAGRFPGYFAVALDVEWKERPDDYKLVKDALDSPASAAAQEEMAWRSYFARLQKEIYEPVFDEPFGLVQIYVWPRAYYEEKLPPGKDKPDYEDFHKGKVKRTAFWLKEELLTWLKNGDRNDAIRIISGGPGSGKSSFTKMFAAELAEDLPVLRIPLHRLNLEKEWETSVSDYVKTNLKLEFNPLNPADDQLGCLVIFDGVDELVQEGKIAEELVASFLDHVKRELGNTNQYKRRVKVIISGREYTIQSHKDRFRAERQVLHLLAYNVEEDFKETFSQGSDLLKLDQRDDWWRKFGACKGLDYTECPQEIKEGAFGNIISQPLLNHLVARVYQKGDIDFSQQTNPSVIYDKILGSVFHREEWAGTEYSLISTLTEQDFNRFLEEVAVCAWHGGRCTTASAIEKRCQVPQLRKVLEALKTRASRPVRLLLTAFYFREGSSDHKADRTIEFTHKSFYEYLTARRIIRQLEIVQRNIAQRSEDPDTGWDIETALLHWTEFFGPTAMDQALYEFLSNEIAIQSVENVRQWQLELINLTEHMLRFGMPMHRLNPRPSYREELRQARNAEEALLACMSACARTVNEPYAIEWPEETSAGDWIARLRGQRKSNQDYCLSLLMLNNIGLNGQFLFTQDLSGANLRSANLCAANLIEANLIEANLRGADLREAQIDGARGVTSAVRKQLEASKQRGGDSSS